MKKTTSGFTIVELMIVIVVIGILAAITIVAYVGVRDRALSAALDTTIDDASKKIQSYELREGSYPNQLSDIGVTPPEDVSFNYVTGNDSYCLSATKEDVSRVTYGPNQPPILGDCSMALALWNVTGGMSYDSESNQFISNGASGAAYSPMVANDGAAHAKITADVYATEPSPNGAPNSRNHFSSEYYAADKTTRVNNTWGYKGNGNASCTVPLLTWTSCSWTTATGPDVEFVRFVVRSSTSYASDNIYKNITIETVE